MPDVFIIIIVAVWIFSAVNSIRKAVQKSQAQAQAQARAPRQGQSAPYASGVRPTPAQRVQAVQQMARVIRAVPATVQAATTSVMPQFAPPAPSVALADMVAPSMPAFDALSLVVGSTGPGDQAASGWARAFAAGRVAGLTEGQSDAALAIIAAAVIGPPVGLRSGANFAADW